MGLTLNSSNRSSTPSRKRSEIKRAKTPRGDKSPRKMPFTKLKLNKASSLDKDVNAPRGRTRKTTLSPKNSPILRLKVASSEGARSPKSKSKTKKSPSTPRSNASKKKKNERLLVDKLEDINSLKLEELQELRH